LKYFDKSIEFQEIFTPEKDTVQSGETSASTLDRQTNKVLEDGTCGSLLLFAMDQIHFDSRDQFANENE
jgi:hypothetical protein